MLNQQLILGSVYRVKFKGVFERHGVCTTPGLTCLHKGNGVFRLEAITTFRTLVLSGVKLYDTFFAPLGITSEEYDQYYSDKPADKYSPVYAVQEVKEKDTQTEWAMAKDNPGQLIPIKKTVTVTNEKFVETGESVLAKYAKDSVNFAAYPIYKFVDVVDPNDIVYAPALTIDGFPEIEISEYQDLSLVFRLGYFDDPTKLDPMLLAIRERMAAYGVKPRYIKLYSTGSKFMNPDEYEKVRNVRLPAEVIQIPEDALASDYVEKQIIQTNKILIIKDPAEGEQLADDEIDFKTLKAREMILDGRLYRVEVDGNDLFNGSSTYYELLKRGDGETFDTFRVLSDCPTGGRVMKLVERMYIQPDANVHRPAYTVTNDVYVQIAFNEPRSLSLYMKETTKTEREEVSVDTITEYRHPTPAELDDPNLVLYRKLSPRYEKVTNPVVGQTYFVSESQTSTIGTGIIYRDNYADSKILELVGTNFEYKTQTAAVRHVTTMTAADIINFAQGAEVEGIELYIAGDDATNQARAGLYGGRLFRTTKSVTVNEKTETIPVEIVVPDEPDPKLAGITGDILGQRGIVSRDTYLLLTEELGRNYYIKYLKEVQENRELSARNKKLELAIKQLAEKQQA